MKQKRAFLLAEETLKIILAVIALGFLAYLLFSIYQNSKDSKNLELAEESLNFLMSEIQEGKTQVEIYNPNGWAILSWPYEGIIPDKPSSCENLGWESCVCIADSVGVTGIILSTLPLTKDVVERYRENSDEGICVESSFTVLRDGIRQPIPINNPPITLQINHEEESING